MAWWMYVLIACSVLISLFLFFYLVRVYNSRKKLKFKTPHIKQPQKQDAKEDKEFEGIIFDEQEKTAPINKVNNEFQVEEFENSEDDLLDEEAEKRYQDFMARHNRIEKMFEEEPSPKQNTMDDFDEFRNQFCYSKYVTDTKLAKKLKDLPPNARKMMLNDLFKEINGENFDIKL